MGPLLASLLRLQSIEHDLAHVRRRLRSKENATRAVQQKIQELSAQRDRLGQEAKDRQALAGRYDLDLKSVEAGIAKLRVALNSARTNKEYAAILTQINTQKADNAKLEEEALKAMQSVDALKTQADAVTGQIEAEQKRLDELQAASAAEVDKLNAILADLQGRRDEAAKDINADVLKQFDRIASAHEGEAMANLEVVDPKRGEYICGGCYIGLRAEHYNALLSRDEIRTCESCGRILYLEAETEANRS